MIITPSTSAAEYVNYYYESFDFGGERKKLTFSNLF